VHRPRARRGTAPGIQSRASAPHAWQRGFGQRWRSRATGRRRPRASWSRKPVAVNRQFRRQDSRERRGEQVRQWLVMATARSCSSGSMTRTVRRAPAETGRAFQRRGVRVRRARHQRQPALEQWASTAGSVAIDRKRQGPHRPRSWPDACRGRAWWLARRSAGKSGVLTCRRAVVRGPADAGTRTPAHGPAALERTTVSGRRSAHASVSSTRRSTTGPWP